MQFLPFPCSLVPLRPKYSQHPVLKHPQPTILPQCERPSFTPIQNNGKIIVLCILIFYLLLLVLLSETVVLCDANVFRRMELHKLSGMNVAFCLMCGGQRTVLFLREQNERLRRLSLSRVDHVWKIKDRKGRTDTGKYSFVNRTIRNWNQLPAEAVGTFPCKPNFFF